MVRKQHGGGRKVASGIYNGMYGKTENIDIGFHQITDGTGLHAAMDGLQ